MSLRHPTKPTWASVAPLLAFILCVLSIAAPDFAQAQGGAVQSYADQAVPPVPPVFYDSPLAAGTLTLQDVLEAHKAPAANLPEPNQLTAPGSPASAPLLTPTLESSATSLMMEQGMKTVLQKTGDASVQVTPPVVRASTAQGQPASLVAGASAPTPAPADTASNMVGGVKYEPGQAPKNLASAVGSPAATVDSTSAGIASSATPAADGTASPGCDQKTKKWEKTCVEAGYPAAFVGKIFGETRMGCTDGVLHDFWVSNTCAPPDGSTLATPTVTATASVPSPNPSDTESVVPIPATTETHEALTANGEFCGAASEILAYEAPSKDLCRVGAASAVNGDGPWTWSCTDNDGRTSSCRTLALSGDDAYSASVPAAAVTVPAPAPPPVADMTATPPAQASASMLAVPAGSSTHASSFTSAPAELACGTAASQPAAQAPDQDLCENGKASAVRGHGPWHWTCSKGKHKLSCETAKSLDASCGSSNGATLESAPFLGLCAAGTPTSVSGNGPWNWSCNGSGGGVSVACAATAKNKEEVPAATSQSSGSVDGICGTADGVATFVKPADGLCLSGVVGTVASLGGKGNGPWTWNCAGTSGGHTATCAAPLPSNADGSDAVPAAKPSKKKKGAQGFPAAPTPTTVPPPADVSGIEVPSAAPSLSDDSQPVTPPSLKNAIAPAPMLQDDMTPLASSASSSGGSHLSLDPTISTILFTRGSGAIDNQVLTTLDKLSAVLQANGDVRITLTAYADSDSSTPRDARRLSLTRALAVRDYLGSKGISDSRIDVRAEGANTTGYIDRVDVRVND